MMLKSSAESFLWSGKAIELYRRAATKYFSDAGYAALQAAFGYIFHIGHLPLDWGLIAT